MDKTPYMLIDAGEGTCPYGHDHVCSGASLLMPDVEVVDARTKQNCFVICWDCQSVGQLAVGPVREERDNVPAHIVNHRSACRSVSLREQGYKSAFELVMAAADMHQARGVVRVFWKKWKELQESDSSTAEQRTTAWSSVSGSRAALKQLKKLRPAHDTFDEEEALDQ